MRMFAQGSLLLIMMVSLASSLPQSFLWAKNKLFPGVPVPNPLPKNSEDIPNVPGGTLEKTGKTGVPSMPDVPINNVKDSLPVEEELPINAPTVGDKPNLPDLGVPDVPSIPKVPGLNSLPVNNAKDNLPLPVNAPNVVNQPSVPEVPDVPTIPNAPGLNSLPDNAKDNLSLPNGDLPVNAPNVDSQPFVPEVPDVPSIPEVPGLDTMPKDSLPVPKGDLPINTEAVGDTLNLPGVPGVSCIAAVPGVNSLPNNIANDNLPPLPLPKGDLPIYAPSFVKKPTVPAFGAPGSDKHFQLNDLNRRISKLEAVLKLEGRIQVVGDKMIACSGKEVDFATSKSTCNDLGGQIASPKNEKENAAVLTFVKKYNRYAYLGIREGPVPGFFIHMNGVPALYTRWRKAEPSAIGKNYCTEMYTDGQWNNKVCNKKRLTICEF